jgi:hypothetical protein
MRNEVHQERTQALAKSKVFCGEERTIDLRHIDAGEMSR